MSKRYVAPLKRALKSISTANPTYSLNFFADIPIRKTLTLFLKEIMSIFKTLAIFLMVPGIAFGADSDLQKILQVRPGEKLEKAIKASQSSKTFSYEIELDKDLVESVSIELNPPIPSEKFLKADSKGFCLVQPRIHTNIKRFFFFDMDSKRRYEVNYDKKIIGILIQDIPGARANPECTFGSINPTADKK